MRSAIQWNRELSAEKISEAGFGYTELYFDMEDCLHIEEALEEQCREIERAGLAAAGIAVPLQALRNEYMFSRLLAAVDRKHIQYITIDTRSNEPLASGVRQELPGLLEKYQSRLEKMQTDFYIENGYAELPSGIFTENAYSDARKLRTLVQELNTRYHTNRYKIAWNIGYANLLQKNLPEEIPLYEGVIGLVHINDNDGYTNQKQMPFTFTVGRGTLSTKWYRIIGQLVRSHFDGWMTADTAGLWARTPKELHLSMLQLLDACFRAWEDQFQLENWLEQPEKKLILFGSGNMAQDYMKEWGEKYPPVCLVDNDPSKWGKRRFGAEIIPPQKLLDIPQENINLLICNMYYDEIKEQLDGMGVSYRCYMDHYYF